MHNTMFCSKYSFTIVDKYRVQGFEGLLFFRGPEVDDTGVEVPFGDVAVETEAFVDWLVLVAVVVGELESAVECADFDGRDFDGFEEETGERRVDDLVH